MPNVIILGDLVTELALWLCIALLLFVIGYGIMDWQFWALSGTYWAVSVMSRKQGTVEGVINFLNLPTADQERVRQALKEIEREQDQ